MEKQVEGLVKNLESNLERSESDDIFKLIKDNLPSSSSVGLGQEDLFSELERLTKEVLNQYNGEYGTNYTMENIPTALQESIEDRVSMTLNGDGKKYFGVDGTTAKDIARQIGIDAVNELKQSGKLSVDGSKNLISKLIEKKQSIIKKRADVLAELIASPTFHETVEKLAENDGNNFVGVRIVKDNRTRDTHRPNEGKYWRVDSRKKFWMDWGCRCQYVFGKEEDLKKLGFIKFK